MNLHGKEVRIEGHVVKIARLAAEGFEFLENPEASLQELRAAKQRIDIFTFEEPLAYTSPRFDYRVEWDNLAVLPITTFEHWWNKQIDGKTRNVVRRAEKKGIVVREVTFDDHLVAGIYEIYNESPVRQGRLFPHYGKDFEAVRRMSATFLDRSTFLGAYYEGRLVGFIKMTADEARAQMAIMHIIALVRYRDKAPTNALIAGAVRWCAGRGFPYLIYSQFFYGRKKHDKLRHFKQSNGFQPMNVPRYYVPFTSLGALALRLHLHHSALNVIPDSLAEQYRALRASWYMRRFKMLSSPRGQTSAKRPVQDDSGPAANSGSARPVASDRFSLP
jgi:hypothetical protein